MRKILSAIVCCLLCTITASAQRDLRIHYKDGTHIDIALGTIDSLTVVESTPDDNPQTPATLTGGWLWGSVRQGYYELIQFNADYTYTGYDYYFTYGFDTQTFGWYSYFGSMLSLQSNGYGYMYRYNWYVTALTDNALTVITRMGPFTYYRLQPEVLHLKAQGQPLSCAEGEAFVFADGVTCAITDDGALQGLLAGTTYVQKQLAASGTIVSYKVVVE